MQSLIGADDFGILGFKEHVFTQTHSTLGRYMALAEHAFGTMVQRYLYNPHHIRLHYGHPDMVNAHMVKKTGGVSRGCLRVNVNEDIFLGYEMAARGINIGYSEALFYGKGRDAEFNAASVRSRVVRVRSCDGAVFGSRCGRVVWSLRCVTCRMERGARCVSWSVHCGLRVGWCRTKP